MQPRPCPSCSRVDAWRPRPGFSQQLLVWLLPFRGYRCAGCGTAVWGLASTRVNTVRLVVWALAAIALGWSAGRQPAAAPDRPEQGPPAMPAGAPAPVSGSSASELAVLIPLWAEAWTEGRAGEYFSFYSPRFAPEDGEEIDAWRSRARAAMAADRPPLRLTAFEVDSLGPGRARVRLDRDPAVADIGTAPGETPEAPAAGGLELELVREADGWKIVRQRPSGPR